MSGLRTELKGELQCSPIEESANHRTWETQYARYCAMCDRVLYIDEDTVQRINYAARTGLGNHLRCERCGEEYGDLAYEG
jgi:hypothetical protein